MQLSHIILQGFKSFAKKTTIDVTHQVTGVVGPNGSGKSNIVEAIRFALGEQSMKSLRGKTGSDVIFKGSEHLSSLGRASVTLVIANKNKAQTTLSQASDTLAPFLVYDELTLSRTIYADGTSEYTLNGAKVRLKDVQELLSFAGIGSSAHTIISQGEADRILLGSPKDRKEALEDALSLRVYHMRLAESIRKLDKVKSHVHEVELLRNEIKPHLTHLERQVKKIEQIEEERKKLFAHLIAYSYLESRELSQLEEHITSEGTSSSLSIVTASIEKELTIIKNEKNTSPEKITHELHAEEERIKAELAHEEGRKVELIKIIGRIEGEISGIEKELQKLNKEEDVQIPLSDLREVQSSSRGLFLSLSKAITDQNISLLKEQAELLTKTLDSFFSRFIAKDDDNKKREYEETVHSLKESLSTHEKTLSQVHYNNSSLVSSLSALSHKKNNIVNTFHEEEKKIMTLESKLRELRSVIALREQEEKELVLRREHFEVLLSEVTLIVGRKMISYHNEVPDEKLLLQPKHDLMRQIERSKLRIEEAGIPNKEEIVREFAATKERDEYLIRELEDIRKTEEKLQFLINDLSNTLSQKFTQGVTTISESFSLLFAEIFPGGKAKLYVTKKVTVNDIGEQEEESGIDIDVSLPNKKVKELHMFSGGEKTLVSIALLFAMSQVTPPPFMVLDETDAPLDEANARKYGAMLTRLANNSKLLVITHNRETMNYCDMLYGVTLGGDGGSKLLSISFKEAEKIVKE